MVAGLKAAIVKVEAGAGAAQRLDRAVAVEVQELVQALELVGLVSAHVLLRLVSC